MKKKNISLLGLAAAAMILTGAGCTSTTSTDFNGITTTTPGTNTTSTTSTVGNPSTSTTSTKGDDDNSTSSNKNEKKYEVEIDDNRFSPNTITIQPNTRVIWTNEDAVAHTVTADSASKEKFNSGTIVANGGVFNYTFTKPGQYTYYCAIHPSMTGTIVVK